ncbi:MAG: hypothetical protein JWN99_1164 [Ilumatobacteraceae bacterium]|nr:hypothetical protein [Ilumatobacteraceae bacterium]
MNDRPIEMSDDQSSDDRISDDMVIARMRSALDEVAGATSADSDPALIPVRHTTPDPRRWIGLVAATVLLVGGATFALTRRSSDDPAAAPATTTPVDPATTSAATSPATTMPAIAPITTATAITTPITTATAGTTIAPAPTTTIAILGPRAPWFTVDSPEITLGPVTHRAASPADEQVLTQTWTVDQGDVGGFMTVQIVQGVQPRIEGDYTVEDLQTDNGIAYFLRPNGSNDGTGTPDSSGPLDYGFELRWFRDDGSAWVFQSQGLTRDQLVAAAFSAVPGSGVPIIIDDPSFTTLSVSTPVNDAYVQYDVAAKGLFALSVEHDGSPLGSLISAANIVPVTVAGMPGYAAQLYNNAIAVAWDAGNGWWGHMWIGEQIARGADGIIASVTTAELPIP